MLCTGGHNNTENAQFCSSCGVNTFQPGTSTGVVSANAATNGLAIASLVLGIVWVFYIGSILALIFGLVAHKQIKVTGQSGKGMATAGIVLGSIGITFLILSVVIMSGNTYN